MNINIRLAVILILLCAYNSISAQSRHQFGLLPSFNLNKEVKPTWRINLKIESRQSLHEGTFQEESDWQYDYLLTDFALLGSKTFALNNTVAGGYLLRVENGELVHRWIQQFTHVQKYARFRMAHRFSMDQTREEDVPMEYRFRYRVTGLFPLNGTSIDPKELYLKINNEYLNAFEGSEYDLEIRLIPLLGYQFSDTNKLELGLDYRLDSFVGDDTPQNDFYTSLNWYIKI